MPSKESVSILLVMDDGLGGLDTLRSRPECVRVSILLVMDDGLGEVAEYRRR